MAIRIFSIQEAMGLKDKIPRLVLIRSLEFQGIGYNKERDGYLILLEAGDDLTQLKEIGEDGLFSDDVPNFEFVETFVDADGAFMEIVFALDSERSVGIFACKDSLDPDLFALLQKHSSPPQPMPTLERSTP